MCTYVHAVKRHVGVARYYNTLGTQKAESVTVVTAVQWCMLLGALQTPTLYGYIYTTPRHREMEKRGRS